MKRLMLGNEAIARGAYEAGATVAAAYPGTPSSEILSSFAKYEGVYAEWSPNEKVALEVGAGASVGGARTLVAMKHVGVNVAADPLYTLSYIGVNGGLVLVSADDPGMYSSQNEQDNRGYGRFAKIPVLEPSDSQEARDFTKFAFFLSEEFDTPVILRTTTRLSHSQTLVEEGEREEIALKEYKKDAAKYVMLPGYARLRHVEVEKRMARLKEYVETTPLNRIEWGDKSLGIITSGIPYQYVKEVLPTASVLKLGITNPLPEKLIREFAEKVERLIVVEELEPVIEEQVKALGIKVEGKNLFSVIGEYSPELIEEKIKGTEIRNAGDLSSAVPARPPLMCPGCPHRGVFYTLRKKKLVVTGDIGCYTLGALSPLDAMDTCLCMGASIGMALGMEKARGREFAQKTVAVIGDSTFVHSGITALIDVVYNKGISTVLILDNDTTAMTGHQEHPATGFTIKNEPTYKLDLPTLVKAVGVEHIRIVDPLNLAQLEQVLDEELSRKAPSVIITKRPCVLLKKYQQDTATRYFVDDEACTGCKQCIRVGCTGVYFDDDAKKARINLKTCVACGLCPQVCKFDAIKVMEG
ncbi:indolepyruvate ferredoxin oxidoreductase alpha subunit [Thermosyntropha lipolytica DSM 11003]|uniref:Indolepyruvate oxidoreductase subunit IorA n=1 Tax=Thermosyntropha lipolytica DSM 11003 TaxID=1123382 RepID=A0A1M5L869_9FIRM|nr:indolepyruvate ferredoxin oxidoreductase subunit alpha [Thermosyntropha lipolytica]SHG61160.1 indolepyruvate ferredoxin oxidoreductase alpha subunit [Thermosyntropha lipolytica DSM 11003]